MRCSANPKSLPGQSNFSVKGGKLDVGLNGEELPFLYRSYLSISMTTEASTTCSFPPLSQEAKKQHLVLLPILGSADEEIWPIVVAELLFVSQICQTPRPQVSVPVCRDFMYLTLPSSRASLFCKKWMCSVILNQLRKSSFKARVLIQKVSQTSLRINANY